ncbi:MAG: hypothetical protein V5A39_05315 [Haloarculaceae archaeon]
MVPRDDGEESESLVISSEGESAEYLKSTLDSRWRKIAQRVDDDKSRD